MNEECNKGRRHPFTTAQLFQAVYEILKSKKLMPDNLEYALPTTPQVKILTNDFRLRNNLGYGGSEGIYLDVYLEFKDEKGEIESKGLGTFKILDGSNEAMHIMANLLADFIVELREFVNAHKSDFIWQGVSVFPYENGERLRVNLLCDDMEAALEIKDQLLEKYGMVEVQDNKTRKAVVYER